jgi:hypothetical protein
MDPVKEGAREGRGRGPPNTEVTAVKRGASAASRRGNNDREGLRLGGEGGASRHRGRRPRRRAAVEVAAGGVCGGGDRSSW